MTSCVACEGVHFAHPGTGIGFADRQLDPSLELKYNKFYIGLVRQGQPDNFVIFRPKEEYIRVEPRLDKDDVVEHNLEAAGVDVMDYDDQRGRYRIRLGKGDVKKHAELLTNLFSAASKTFATNEA